MHQLRSFFIRSSNSLPSIPLKPTFYFIFFPTIFYNNFYEIFPIFSFFFTILYNLFQFVFPIVYIFLHFYLQFNFFICFPQFFLLLSLFSIFCHYFPVLPSLLSSYPRIHNRPASQDTPSKLDIQKTQDLFCQKTRPRKLKLSRSIF